MQQTPATPSPSKLSLVLNAHPPKGMAFVMQAIILSLFAHIFILSVMYLSTASPGVEGKDETPEVEEMELKFDEPTPEEEVVQRGEMSEEVRNLLANAQSERTSERVNYSAKSKEEIAKEVEEYYKNLEKSEFEQLKSGHKDYSVDPAPSPDKNNSNKPKEDNYEWYKNQSNKSYSGPVSAEYFLSGRTAKSSPKPTYRCKASGKVVVRIEVDANGAVTGASVDDAKSIGSECIREESLAYAQRWKFDYKADAPRKQAGTITFVFSSQ